MATTKVAIAPMKVAQIPNAGADFQIVETGWDEKLTFLARKLNADDWSALQKHICNSADAADEYEGDGSYGEEAMDDLDEPIQSYPAGKNLESRGTVKRPAVAAKPAMDAAATRDFYAEMGGEPPRNFQGSYGALASDASIPSSPSRTAVDSFKALFPEAEPVRHV
jgi:hypothetical protein